MIFIPILFYDDLFESTLINRFAYLNIILIAYLVFNVLKKEVFFLPPIWLSLIIISFYFIHILSAFWSINLGDSILESQRILLGICVFFISYNKLKKARQVILLRSIGITALIILLIGVWNVYQNGVESEVSILFGHKNLQSSLLFICLPFLGVLTIDENGYWKYFAMALIILITVFLVFAGARSNLLALFVVVLFISGSFIIKRKKLRGIFYTGFFFGLICGFIWLLTCPEIVADRDASIAERFGLWENTFRIIEDDTMLGVGSGNWQHHYTKYGVSHLERTVNYNTAFRRPHNEYLRIFSETGITGLILTMVFVIMVGYRSVITLKAQDNLKLLISFGGLIGIGLIAFFSFPHERFVHLTLSAILLAFLCSVLYKEKELSLPGKRIYLSLILVLLGFNLFFTNYRILGELYTKKSIQAQVDNDSRAAISYGNKALSKFYQTDPTGTPVYSYIGWGYHDKTIMDSILFSAEHAYMIRPYDYRILNNYGLILERMHYYRTSKKVLEESHRINPKFEPTLVNLSVMEYNQGNFEQAKYWMEQIKNSRTKYPKNWERIDHAVTTGEFGEYD